MIVVCLLAPPAAGAVDTDRAQASTPGPDTGTGNGTSGTYCSSGIGPPDPPTDRLGWEWGCWYNDTLDVRSEDGLGGSEVKALAARAMARVEVIRGLEFRDPPTIEIRPRSSFDGGDRTVARARELRKNVRFEALFLVNGSTNAVRTGFGVGGYYAYWDNRIVFVSRNDSVDVHEFKLAHELVHVLQHDHFEGEDGPRRLFDRSTANSALTEGEANVVTQEYKERCLGAWQGTCFPPPDWTPREERQRGQWCDVDDPHFNIGRSLLGSVEYTAGPAFVAALRERGGWERVARAQREPPNSTEQVLHPEKYPADRPRNVTVRDRSSADWRVIQPAREGRPAHFRLGEAGLYVMLWYQSFHTDHEAPIIPCRDAYRPSRPRALINYSHPLTAGWDGDALLPYVANGSANASDVTSVPTGYVWKIAWDSPEDARAFAGAYRDLLDAHDATRVPGRADTYRIPDDSGFAAVVYLRASNASVLVVSGPSVDAVRELRPDAAPQGAASPSPGSAGAREPGTPREVASPVSGSTGARGPGFGVASALVALVCLGYLRSRT